MKNKLNRSGFTLIEILAVIIILGIIMVIAVPSVSNYILDSRKNTYVSTIKGYADAVRNKINNFEYSLSNKDIAYYVPISNIELDKGGNSPFGDWVSAYVVVTYNGREHSYYWTSVDTSGYKVILEKKVEDITTSDIINDTELSISTRKGIAGRDRTCVVDENGICNSSDIMDAISE